MSIKISDLPTIPLGTFADDDIFEISVEDGGGGYDSYKITGAELKASIATLETANQTITANSRVVNLNGSTSSNELLFKNSSGAELLTIQGDGKIFADGGTGIATNTSFGDNALKSTATGTNNTAFGANSLLSLSTGSRNTAVGLSSLYSNTTGQYNTALGYNSLVFGNASNNTALGYQAFALNGEGGGNSVAVGYNAGYQGAGGGEQVYIGYSSGATNDSGTGNTSVGYNAYTSCASGDYNAVVGWTALSNVVGDNNVAIGKQAGRYIGTGGTFATSSDDSIFIGNDARPNAQSQSNQIVIGDSARGNGTNTVTIGNSSIVLTVLQGTVNMAGLPTSATGLNTGDVWNNSGVLNIA